MASLSMAQLWHGHDSLCLPGTGSGGSSYTPREHDRGLGMRVEPLSEALGVELSDFDIARPCSTAEQAELRDLFCEHHLLLVRGQDVTADDQSRFVGYFGPLHAGRTG